MPFRIKDMNEAECVGLFTVRYLRLVALVLAAFGDKVAVYGEGEEDGSFHLQIESKIGFIDQSDMVLLQRLDVTAVRFLETETRRFWAFKHQHDKAMADDEAKLLLCQSWVTFPELVRQELGFAWKRPIRYAQMSHLPEYWNNS